MSHLLSIVVPYYNAASTIQSAIASLLTQSLTYPYEIIICDDGSNDESKTLLESIARDNDVVRIITMPTNMGGGAARNAAVAASVGDIILCFDSDDILPAGMAEKMISFMLKRKSDGVVFQESRFFRRNPKIYRSSKSNFDTTKDITLSTLFTDKSSLFTQVNFMYTRDAFNRAGGYPDNHGFDTQGFGFRFLARGNRAVMCPNSYYFHRQGYKKSYFEREYEKGAFSKNTYLIYEDVLFAFSPSIQQAIAKFDVFAHASLEGLNLSKFIESQYRTRPEEFLSGFTSYFDWQKDKEVVKNGFAEAVCLFHQGKYNEALEANLELLRSGDKAPLIYFNLLRCLIALSGVGSAEVEQTVDSVIASISPRHQKSFVTAPLWEKGIHHLFNLRFHPAE